MAAGGIKWHCGKCISHQVADKMQWSRWREVEFMLEGWAIAYRSCFGSTQGWWWQRVAQSGNVANAYHTKSLADKVWWSRWREVEFMLEGWAIAYGSCLW